MKTKFIILSMTAMFMLSSCGTQKFYIGDTSGKETQSQKSKYIKVFWFISIGKKQYFSAAKADGYIVTTRYNIGDLIVSGITGSMVNMKTVKFEAYRTQEATTK